MEMHLPLVLFSYFLAIASGLFFGQGVLTLKGITTRTTQYITVIGSIIAIGVGGISVFFHLQHWTRIFNGFGHLSSPITMEIIGIVIFVVVLAVYFLVFFRTEDGIAPKWTGVLGIGMGLLMMYFVAESYVLASTPVWASPLGIVSLMLAVPAVAGPAMMILVYINEKNIQSIKLFGREIELGGITGEQALAGYSISKKMTVIGILLFIIAVVIYAVQITMMGDTEYADLGFYFDPTLPDIAMVDTAAMTNVFTGDLAVLFWVGVIFFGSLVPVILTVLLFRTKDAKKQLILSIALLVFLSVLIICYKIMFYLLGIHVFTVFTY